MRLAFLILVLIPLAGCGGGETSTSGVAAVPVRSVELVRDVTTTGKVVPEVGAEVKIAPRISGTLTRLHVRVGDFVRRGELIAEIDRGTLASELARAGDDVASAVADERYANAALRRRRALLANGLASQDDVDLAQRDAERAASRTHAARAAADAARVQLGYTRLVSPIDGVVASVSTQEGETVAASFAAPTFVTVVDAKKLKLIAYLDELDVTAVKSGARATFTIDALAGRTFDGVVTSVNPQAIVRDNVTNYVANVDLRGDTSDLRPDMTANVIISTGERTRALVIPDSAIGREPNGDTFVVLKNGGRRRVQLGDKTPQGVIVREGLAASDVIAARP